MDGAEVWWAAAAAAGGAVAALLLVALVVLLRRQGRGRADLEDMLAAAQRESDDLRARLEVLSAHLPDQAATYLITDAGMPAKQVARPGEDPVLVPDRLVLSATLGAPLVKVAAFSHGVRRALSAENRNRIWFEMRKEIRSARKRRRRDVREFQRQRRAEERSGEGLA